MHHPADKLIVATPVANCWSEGDILCIDNLNCTRNTENVLIHYKILQESFPGFACWLKAFPECDVFPDEVQTIAARQVPMNCDTLAIVSPNASVMALSSSYSRVRENGVNVKFFVEEEDARRWLRSKC